MENVIMKEKKNTKSKSDGIDWELVEGFEKSLEDLKNGRIVEY